MYYTKVLKYYWIQMGLSIEDQLSIKDCVFFSRPTTLYRDAENSNFKICKNNTK